MTDQRNAVVTHLTITDDTHDDPARWGVEFRANVTAADAPRVGQQIRFAAVDETTHQGGQHDPEGAAADPAAVIAELRQLRLADAEQLRAAQAELQTTRRALGDVGGRLGEARQQLAELRTHAARLQLQRDEAREEREAENPLASTRAARMVAALTQCLTAAENGRARFMETGPHAAPQLVRDGHVRDALHAVAVTARAALAEVGAFSWPAVAAEDPGPAEDDAEDDGRPEHPRTGPARG